MKTRVGVGVWLGDLMNEDTCGCGCEPSVFEETRT